MNIKNYVSYLNNMNSIQLSETVVRAHKEVPGFSSLHIMSLLSIAVKNMEPNEAYLEVGTYRGRTLIGAMLGSKDKKGFGIDNFSEFCDDPDAREIEIISRIRDFELTEAVYFQRGDYRKFKPPQKVGVYFYDGNHDTEQGLEALEYMIPYLSDKAVIIVDDYAGEGVWQSVVQFCNQHTIEAKPIFAMHTNNFPYPQDLWWNGVIVLGWIKNGEYR